jgi:hypothetical protein
LTHHGLFAAEIFQRLLKNHEFDVAEMGLTFYLGTLSFDDPPFIAIPVFPVRFFRHSAVFVNTKSGISSPRDLVGKRVGEMFCYGTDVGVWIKGIMAEEHAAPTASYRYFVGGVDHYVPPWEWLPFRPPADVEVQQLREGQTLDAMIESGEIDALISALVPASFLKGSPNVRRLFADYESVERDYFRRTGIFPIMHTVVIRREVYRRDPWLAQALVKAFVAAKAQAEHPYRAGAAFMNTGTMVPWLTAHLEDNRRLLGEDPWPYDFAANRKAIDTFLRYHHAQGLSQRRYLPEEIFAPETIGT